MSERQTSATLRAHNAESSLFRKAVASKMGSTLWPEALIEFAEDHEISLRPFGPDLAVLDVGDGILQPREPLACFTVKCTLLGRPRQAGLHELFGRSRLRT